VPDAGTLGLPRHLVEAFAKGWVKSSNKAAISFVPGRASVPPPQVRIDPWDPLGPVLELPSLPPSLAGESWKIENGSRGEVVRVSTLQAQQRRLVPARHWSAELTRAGDVSRTFVF